MGNEKIRIEHILSSDRSGDGDKLVTANTGDSLTQNVPLLYDADGNVISTATRTGNTTNYATATAGSKTSGNYPKWDASGNLTNGDTGGGAGGNPSNPIVGGLAIQYDPAPASPNTEDDEFNSSSLDAKWSVVSNTAAAVDIDTTWASHIYVKFSGDQTYRIEQSYAPSGDFSLTAKARYAVVDNFQQFQLRVRDSANSNGVHVAWAAVNGGTQGEMFRQDSGSNNFVASLLRARVDEVYVHLQRDSTTWSAWFSFSALSWWRIATHVKTLTVSHIDVFLSQIGATRPVVCGIDWVRRDWITL